MRDRHKGETCVLTGMGPSFADVPNEFLESYITFGVNKVWLKKFSPTYYVATDPWMNPYVRWMKYMRCRDYFLTESFCRHLTGAITIGAVLRDTPEDLWEGGGSVLVTCLKIAHLMGFETVLMVGLDHTGDGTHFHPAYDQWGAKRTYRQDIPKVDMSFQVARDEYEKSGRRIINLTPGSKCTVFEKEDIGLWQTHI